MPSIKLLDTPTRLQLAPPAPLLARPAAQLAPLWPAAGSQQIKASAGFRAPLWPPGHCWAFKTMPPLATGWRPGARRPYLARGRKSSSARRADRKLAAGSDCARRPAGRAREHLNAAGSRHFRRALIDTARRSIPPGRRSARLLAGRRLERAAQVSAGAAERPAASSRQPATGELGSQIQWAQPSVSKFQLASHLAPPPSARAGRAARAKRRQPASLGDKSIQVERATTMSPLKTKARAKFADSRLGRAERSGEERSTWLGRQPSANGGPN